MQEKVLFQMIIVIAFGIELFLAFIHYEGHKKIAGYVPEAFASAPRRTWHFFGERATRAGAPKWFKDRLRTTGLALGILQNLKRDMLVWREMIGAGKKADLTALKGASASYLQRIDQL